MPRSFARVALLAASAALAQNPAPIASKTPQAASAPVPAQASPVQTLKANAQLVVVDVVVTDSAGKSIHSLKASDFTLKESGSPQLIKNFEEHSASTFADPTKFAPMPKLPPGIFTNYTPEPANGAVNVLLLDALNTDLKDQMYMRGQLRDFLNKVSPGTRIAIFGLNTRLIMLQGFTSDTVLLRKVLDTPRASASVLLEDNTGNDGTAAISQQVTNVMGDAADMAQLVTSMQQFEAVQASMEDKLRAQQTLDAINQIAHYLAGIPGRKNLIWFSGSFPVDVFPDPDIAHPFATVADSENEFRETSNLLARSQVAVYPIDARGLRGPLTAPSIDAIRTNLVGPGLVKVQQKDFQDRTSDAATMIRLADSSGGRAYVDSNGLADALIKSIEEGSNYYTLSYTPTSAKWEGEFRKIQVQLAEKGLTLTYRNGYFADDPNAKHSLESAATVATAPNSLVRSMLRGAPCPTDIMLKLQVLPATGNTETEIAPGNTLNSVNVTKLKIKALYRRYAIDIAADPHDVHITQTLDGHYQFFTEILTYVYDVDGNLINTARQRAHGYLSPSTLANMFHTGLLFHQEVSVPEKGSYYLRTAVHDVETDRYGAVEIPVASVARLAPLAAQTPPAASPR
jgi:VWFA-related protein